MPTLRLTLEYDGAGFQGWQVQPGGRRTVQGALERAFAQVTGETVHVGGAGRTDAGVHAEAQVAHVRVASALDPAILRRALNAVLPRDVAVVGLEIAPEAFDARRAARGKLYRYAIWNGPHPSPLRAPRTLRVERPLDVAAMREAAAALVGTHDFTSFRAAGSDASTSVRTLTRVEVRTGAPGELWIELEGTGFLRHMVRIAAGTLIEVGRGRRPPGSLPAVLAARARPAAGPTAPAHALTLVRVDY